MLTHLSVGRKVFHPFGFYVPCETRMVPSAESEEEMGRNLRRVKEI